MLSEILADALNSITTKSSYVLDRFVSSTNSFDDYLVGGVASSIKANWENWLVHHPVIAWICSHPIISLVAGLVGLVLTLRLLATIYRAIANTIDKMWLLILRSPWLLLKLLFGWEKKPKTGNSQTTVTNYQVTSNSEQLQLIIQRLDQIQQQQQRIIQDIAQLKQQPVAMELKQIQLLEEQIVKKH
ncbi:MAG: hypothetical protein AAF298_23060 [Cyanobacteria bacterium P01_A01_bin.40]